MAVRELDPEELDRPDWNSLLQNYDKHDIGEAYFIECAEALGFDVVEWGIDRRHHDDHLVFDDKMDLRLWDEDDMVALVDVKTKSNSDWMGKFNLRHLVHYSEHAVEHDAPAFVFMTMVDEEAEEVGQEYFVAPIPGDWDWRLLKDHFDGPVNLSYGGIKDNARECPIIKRTFRAPDGNLVVTIDEEYRHDFDWFIKEVTE